MELTFQPLPYYLVRNLTGPLISAPEMSHIFDLRKASTRLGEAESAQRSARTMLKDHVNIGIVLWEIADVSGAISAANVGPYNYQERGKTITDG